MRAQTCNDCDDPEKSEGQRRAPPFCDEINKRKKQIHTHFIRQASERSDCRFGVGEILKEKNVGEDAGGVQVDGKRTGCREDGQRENGTIRRAQQQECSVDKYEKCGE